MLDIYVHNVTYLYCPPAAHLKMLSISAYKTRISGISTVASLSEVTTPTFAVQRFVCSVPDFDKIEIDPDNVSNVNDVFAKLFKNPGKLMNMIKKVSSKLDEKLKSGELKETELMKEANDLVEKMKNTPGMKNMESMLSKMGLGGMGGAKGGKVNMNLFQSMMKQNIKKSSQRDRMLQKLKERKLAKEKEELLKEMQKAQNTKVSQDNDSFDEYIQKTYNIENSVMKKNKIKKKKKRKKKRKDKR